MEFTKRRATTKSNLPQNDLKEAKYSFLTEVVETVDMNDAHTQLGPDWYQSGSNCSLDDG